MELTDGFMWDALSQDIALAQQQRSQMWKWVAPIKWPWTLIFEGWTMNLFKERVGLFKIVETFGIRDESGLTIRKLNDMKFIQKFWLLEERNWKYLDEIIATCKEKWVDLYNTELLAEVWYKLKVDEVAPTHVYTPVDIGEVMKEVVTTPDPEGGSTQWLKKTKKVAKDLDIKNVDLDALELMPLDDIHLIYKRVTGKWLSVNVMGNKERFVKKLHELKEGRE